MKLSNNAEIVIRLLYSKKVTSTEIPDVFLTTSVKEELLNLDLVSLKDKKYILTDKAIEVIESGGFIVKYPLHNEKGVVMNFNDTLNSYSKDAAKALGLGIINTEFYKKWGKYNNVTLAERLKEAIDYYLSFESSDFRIAQYKRRMEVAKSDYERVLYLELAKIKRFSLIKPLNLLSNVGSSVKLVEFIDSTTGIISIAGSTELIHFDEDYRLTSYLMEELIRQYYQSVSAQYYKSIGETMSFSAPID